MNWIDMLNVGEARVKSIAREGRLDRRQVWVIARGAWSWVVSRVEHDEAPVPIQEARMACCVECEESTCEVVPGRGLALYCGAAEGQGKQGPVCGCLVAMTVAGQSLPAGKTTVGREACPQGKWLELQGEPG